MKPATAQRGPERSALPPDSYRDAPHPNAGWQK
jgi:hypothetical protein